MTLMEILVTPEPFPKEVNACPSDASASLVMGGYVLVHVEPAWVTYTFWFTRGRNCRVNQGKEIQPFHTPSPPPPFFWAAESGA